ncbi:MAG: hypothetical protein ACRD9R_04255 [Pyrinomonadaceae bacterium]
MRKQFFILAAAALTCTQVFAQTQPPRPRPTPNAQPNRTAPSQTAQQRGSGSLDLSDYGVRIAPDQRLIVMMAALEAAGLELNPAGRATTVFRAQVRKDFAALDADLQGRLRRFYELNKLKDPAATPAAQAARYVSLALALGEPPAFESPAHTEDLGAGVLDLLDFVPLLREFYRQSGIGERLPAYLRDHQAEGDRLRRPAAEMIDSVISYLRTQPQTIVFERVQTNSSAQARKDKKKDARPVFVTRERDRRFIVVPDLLAAPGATNFRIIGDDYYVIVPYGAGVNTPEVRRAYLQFVFDPLVLRFSREIALRRADLRKLMDGRAGQQQPAPDASTLDIFDTVARSLVAAADARMTFNARSQALTVATSARLRQTPEAERPRVAQEAQAERTALEDELAAQLADAYERGALLSFYFSEQFRGLEVSGFDVSNFFTDMIARVDPDRELKRPEDYAAPRERALAARRARQQQAAATINNSTIEGPEAARREALIKSLDEANELLRLKKYEEAETRLRALMKDYQGEPRVFFTLAQVASSSAQDAFDEKLRDDRLNLALANYRFAVQQASAETDRPLLSRAYTEMGRILAFFDRNEEALKAFDAAIALGPVEGGAHREATAGKAQLTRQP